MILLDTITYNTFLSIIRNEYNRQVKGLNEDNFSEFILDYDGDKFIHSATLFELYMRDLKRSKGKDFSNFLRDFNELNKYGIKILNDSTWNFNWKSLASAIENGDKFDMSVYTKSKIKYEVISISRYFYYIYLLVSDKLFDDYGDEVGAAYSKNVQFMLLLIDEELKGYLTNYYETYEKKEVSTKKIDNLLGYFLVKIEELIKNSTSNTSTDWTSSGTDYYKDVEKNTIGGIQKAREIINAKGTKLSQLITEVINYFEAEASSKNKRYFSKNEVLYHKNILSKSLQQGYKVTKNDFTDCTIFSAFDFVKNGSGGKLITLDYTLRDLSKSHDVYYNPELYNKFFE